MYIPTYKESFVARIYHISKSNLAMLAWIFSVLASPTFWTSAVLLATALFLLYWRLTSDYRKWADRGIPIIEPPTFPYGNMAGNYPGSAGERARSRELHNKAGRYNCLKKLFPLHLGQLNSI